MNMRSINTALMRPVLIAGAEKKLVIANALLSFLLINASAFHFPAVLLGIFSFMAGHVLLVLLAKHDPIVGALFKASMRYQAKRYYPARSRVCYRHLPSIKTVP